MRKAALLYNPDSGGSKRRQRELESALAVIREGGVEAELVPTESKYHAGDEARLALESGCDTIFACGGDGTIHNIAQVIANSPAALAVLPLGTANALAHDLNIPLKIVAAAKASLHYTPRRIALGRVACTDLRGNPKTRYFVVAAGVGVDAHLFYKLHSGIKQRMGMAAYYAKAWNLWLTYPMTRFVAEYCETGSDLAGEAEVTELLAVRIRQFGGVVQELAPGASLDRDDMRLVCCRTGSRLAYLAYVTRGLLRMRWTVSGIDLAHSTRVVCRYREPGATSPDQPKMHQGKMDQHKVDQRKIYVEADGELLGTLPVEITVVPNALNLLAPPR
jgi:diacylglycerol kinase (ATP)